MQEWLSWSYWTDDWLGSFHFACAIGAIILGPIILFRRKGDKIHRWLGRLWSAMMAVIIISALSMYQMNGGPNLFHFFALVSLVTLSSALWAIWKFKATRKHAYLITHQHCMVWAYFGLFMAGLWQTVFNLVRSDIIALSPSMLYNGLGFFTGLSGGLLFFYLKQKYSAPKSPAKS